MTDDVITTLDLFTDYSDSPLREGGLLERDDLPLTDATWTALEEWARYWNEHHDGVGEWTPGSQRLSHLEQGNHLAERVAVEIGYEFAVRHEGLTFRSDAVPTNAAWADADLNRRIEEGHRDGSTFRWQ
jgi:hypothetical protein